MSRSSDVIASLRPTVDHPHTVVTPLWSAAA
jgi:hypothetical protein